jgi:hypothetical protein
MRAAEDSPSSWPLREPTIKIVLARLVAVEFRPSSTLTPELIELDRQLARRKH